MPFPVVRLARAELRFAPRPWPFAHERRAEIDAHFAGLLRERPQAFNGRVLILHEFAVDDGVLRGAYFETDFASFIAWRDWGWPDLSVRNCFGQAALRAVDGAFVLGVMSSHTMNAGHIYFPSGTPDPKDIVGAEVDLAGSVLRELTEETGLTSADVSLDDGWHAVLAGPRLAMLKTVRSPLTAEKLRARILAHMASEAHPELSDVRIVRGPADLEEMMPEFVRDYLLEMWKSDKS
jgi:8-oxo-dGTP pyrophosphatase MutT (NUDIX family)